MFPEHVPDAQLNREFDFYPVEHMCRDPYSPHVWCKRPAGHPGEHAAGFGPARKRWTV